MPKHELDTAGQPIHVDVDPFIPTGICAICTSTDQDTIAPEDRDYSQTNPGTEVAPEPAPETAE